MHSLNSALSIWMCPKMQHLSGLNSSVSFGLRIFPSLGLGVIMKLRLKAFIPSKAYMHIEMAEMISLIIWRTSLTLAGTGLTRKRTTFSRSLLKTTLQVVKISTESAGRAGWCQQIKEVDWDVSSEFYVDYHWMRPLTPNEVKSSSITEIRGSSEWDELLQCNLASRAVSIIF